MDKISVNGTKINVISLDNADYICITDMLINENIPQTERLEKLNQIAIHQITVLQEVDNKKLLK